MYVSTPASVAGWLAVRLTACLPACLRARRAGWLAGWLAGCLSVCLSVCLCVYQCMFVGKYKYECTYARMCAIYVCSYVRMCIRSYVCIYVFSYVRQVSTLHIYIYIHLYYIRHSICITLRLYGFSLLRFWEATGFSTTCSWKRTKTRLEIESRACSVFRH